MISDEADEPTHPFWQVLVGFILTFAALTAIVVIAVRFAEPGYDKPIILGILGLSCLLVHPKVWWIWEVHGIRMWRELAGDIPILVAYWAIGLSLVAYSVYSLVTMP